MINTTRIRPQIVVIEDDDNIRAVTIEFFKMEGVTAMGFINGKEALDHLLAHKDELPQLIIADVNMPIMGGQGFRAAQMADPVLKDIPFAIMSAVANIDSNFQALGVKHLVRKPIDLDVLTSLIQTYVTN